MKKITSLLLCMVLLLAMLPVGVSAEGSCMEAGVTVVGDGSVTVVVSAKQAAANARLTVDFDSDYLTYVGYDIFQQQIPADKTWSDGSVNGSYVIDFDIAENKAILQDFVYGKAEKTEE